MIQPTLYKPESTFARAHAPRPGCACLQLKIILPDGLNPYLHHHWLAPNEIHCAYDPRWLQEHAMVVWKNVGEQVVANLREILVVELMSKERMEIERDIYEDEEGG